MFLAQQAPHHHPTLPHPTTPSAHIMFAIVIILFTGYGPINTACDDLSHKYSSWCGMTFTMESGITPWLTSLWHSSTDSPPRLWLPTAFDVPSPTAHCTASVCLMLRTKSGTRPLNNKRLLRCIALCWARQLDSKHIETRKDFLPFIFTKSDSNWWERSQVQLSEKTFSSQQQPSESRVLWDSCVFEYEITWKRSRRQSDWLYNEAFLQIQWWLISDGEQYVIRRKLHANEKRSFLVSQHVRHGWLSTANEQSLQSVTKGERTTCLREELCSSAMAACVLASVNLIALVLFPTPSLLQYDKIYWHVQMGNLVYSL